MNRIAVVSSNQAWRGDVLAVLAELQLNIQSYENLEKWWSAQEMGGRPEVLMVALGELGPVARDELSRCKRQYPQLEILVLAEAHQVTQVWVDCHEWIADVITAPLPEPSQLRRSLLRVLEVLRLKSSLSFVPNADFVSGILDLEEDILPDSEVEVHESASLAAAEPTAVEEADTSLFVQEILARAATHDAGQEIPHEASFSWVQWEADLMAARSSDEVLHFLVQAVSSLAPGVSVVVARYLANRRSLLGSHAVGIDAEAWARFKIDYAEQPNFRLADLDMAWEEPQFQQVIRGLMPIDRPCVVNLKVNDQLRAILVVGIAADSPVTGTIRGLANSASRQLSLLDLQSLVFGLDAQDFATGLLSRKAFLKRLDHEVVRARRILKPVSLLLLKVDQLAKVRDEYGAEEANLILKAIGRIVTDRSRVNDILARSGPDEIAILLPHTPKAGALIKAERVRRLVAAADFARLTRKIPRQSVSVAVAEYPADCRDYEELLELADSTLYAAIRRQSNRVVQAASLVGGRPDFESLT